MLVMNNEIWIPVVGYEDCYEVSNHGKVKSLPRKVFSWTAHDGLKSNPGCILSPGIGHYNRRLVALCKNGKVKHCTVASLVAEAFLGPRPEGKQVLHKNDDRSNDHVSNLYYGTHQNNMDDKVKNGNSRKGEKHHKCKLTEVQVKEIKVRLKAGEDHRLLALEFNVSKETIQAIKHGRNWGWL